MASPVTFTFTGEWKKMRLRLDAKGFDARLETEIDKVLIRGALMYQREIRARIRAKKYTPNAALTMLIKQSSKPLVDDGDLFQGITHRKIGKHGVLIGVMRGARSRTGEPLANVAAILNEGAVIPVTTQMRGMFQALADAGRGRSVKLTGRAADLAQRLGKRMGGIKPLSKLTKNIIIPPRRFLSDPFKDPMLKAKTGKMMEQAVQRALSPKGKNG